MLKPKKPILFVYIVWFVTQIILGVVTLINGSWIVDTEIWLIHSMKLDGYYDIVEMILYTGLPVIIWWLYSYFVEKYY